MAPASGATSVTAVGVMGALLVSAFGIGLAFCAPPGAVTAEGLRRGLRRGFWSVLALELGSLIGDATWAAIALSGAGLLAQQRPVRLLLGCAGVAFLFRLAWGALAAARAGGMPPAGAAGRGGDFGAGALLSLTNPFAIAFWLGVGGAP
jgi:chemosensory pili system protein ChpE